VRTTTLSVRFAKAGCVALWLLGIAVPLLVLAADAVSSAPPAGVVRPVFASLLRTGVLAAVIAAAAVALGWVPGRLLATSTSHGIVLLFLLLMPLVLPQYVLYYAWALLLSPTSHLGQALATRPGAARLVGLGTSAGVLIAWYWPLAALILAQGWRGIDGRIWDSARLEAGGGRIFRHITLPLLGPALLLAFGACFVLSLSEFATFHLAGVKTVGTELAVLYELTGSTAPVARAAWPVVLLALPAALSLTWASRGWTATTVVTNTAVPSRAYKWGLLVLLLVFSWTVPVVLLLANVTTWQPFRQFLVLHSDDLLWSLLTAGTAALLACLMAWSGLFCMGSLQNAAPVHATTRGWCHAHACVGMFASRRRDAYASVSMAPTGPHPLAGPKPREVLACLSRKALAAVIPVTLFLAMFLPASLLAVSLLKMLNVFRLSQNWWAVSLGQASRFAGLALILLLLMRYPGRRRLTEMAALDGASPARTWWHVHLPRTWPILAGTLVLVTMFSFTELAATMVLLPAGLPNFAQRLLNQMHYARDQQVIASCLVLVSLFIILAGAVVALLRLARLRCSFAAVLALFVLVSSGGCAKSGTEGAPKVLNVFGRTGAGPGECLYPRGIDLGSDGSILVVDKTGRVQWFTGQGQYVSAIRMPRIDSGLPTGMSLHPDGRLFVADTHCHRVAIFAPGGEMVGEFGKYGEQGGCFIYPTDVAFGPDGRIFVSEYGGNDRVSVFTSDGDFLFSFGAPGPGEGQFSRPQALCLDRTRECLYIADACNHRIAVYDLSGHLLSYIGSAGRGRGQLRYPYGLSLLADGTIVVCEFGNNRIQLFSPQGQSRAVYGGPGRQLGQLAYPWAVAVDAHRRAYIVDAGNNRIQVWQL
jgi:ABC-type Fe3+ transport system permease subunit/DNA-binding beta-propeller fold protein YncE